MSKESIIDNKSKILYTNFSEDTELYEIFQKEIKRQTSSLELIASENFTSISVLQANSSIFTNKYAEGYTGKRYYGGTEYIDELEELCKKRALIAFNLDKDKWDVNVQSYSGSTANFAVYTGLLQPGDRLMGLDLPSGGHLTHGYYTNQKKISNSSIYFQSFPYTVGEDFLIDYVQLEKDVKRFKPKLLIVGASAYPRDFDYQRFRKIADTCGAYLMADIAHISGLVSSGLLNNPFEYVDVVTTTTHKTLRGPRAALIFYKKELKDKIDFAVFPSCQGGAHYNTICAITTALKQVASDEYKEYSKQVIKNARILSSELQKYGFDILTNGTDNHIVMINLKNKGITGSKFEKIAELCNISLNKNTIATDISALSPSGIRLGTPAMTSRGFFEEDFVFVAKILNECCKIVIDIQNICKTKKLDEFSKNISLFEHNINKLKEEVIEYCERYPLPIVN